MADSSTEFSEAERKRMEIIDKQFARSQRKIAQMKRQNIAVFGCLLLSVAGICILLIFTYTLLLVVLQLYRMLEEYILQDAVQHTYKFTSSSETLKLI